MIVVVVCGLAAAAGVAVAARGWATPQRRRRRPRVAAVSRSAPLRRRGVVAQLVLGAACGAGALWASGLLGFGLLGVGLGVLLPPFAAAPRRRRRASREALAWQELTRQLGELTRAGASLPEALAAASGYAPAELREELQAAVAVLDVLGVEAALDRLGQADRNWAPQLAAGLRGAYRSGGPASSALVDMGARIGDVVDLHRIKTEAVARVWTQTIALFALAGGVIALMWANNPDYFAPYARGGGQLVLVAIALLLVLALGFLVRHSVVREEVSVLVPPTERELKRRREAL